MAEREVGVSCARWRCERSAVCERSSAVRGVINRRSANVRAENGRCGHAHGRCKIIALGLQIARVNRRFVCAAVLCVDPLLAAARLDLHKGPATCLDVSISAGVAVVCSSGEDGSLHFINVGTKQLSSLPSANSASTYAVKFSGATTLVAAGQGG